MAYFLSVKVSMRKGSWYSLRPLNPNRERHRSVEEVSSYRESEITGSGARDKDERLQSLVLSLMRVLHIGKGRVGAMMSRKFISKTGLDGVGTS